MYDYIIVGAGSAGCALAARLSENPEVSVLLLEAGPRRASKEAFIPAAFSQLFRSARDWGYDTEPEPALNDRAVYWPRGKMVGGSSAMNAMIYIRGSHADYDRWRDLGNPGWGWSDVLPYFLRAEGNSGAADGGDSRSWAEFHSRSGPLTVSDQRSPSPLTLAYLEAAQQFGLPRTDDFNGPEQDGVGLNQVTQRGGFRCSAARAYLAPARRRPNLTVRADTKARGIRIEGGRAVGVDVVVDGVRQTLRAEREVVLSAGAINSPQLLQLSGIGPADDLRRLGIEVVLDLPAVGAGLADHPAVPLIWTSDTVDLLAAESPASLLQLLLRRRGPLTSNVGEGGAHLRSDDALDLPDLQQVFAPVMYLEHGLIKPPGHGYTLGTMLVDVTSRGRVWLRTADPNQPPAMVANYVTEPEDMAALVRGVRKAMAIGRLEPLARHATGEHAMPASDSDEDIRAHIRATAFGLYHPVGTCAMGPAGPDTVVDPELRVHGVEGLRVVDASVMPRITRGNTNAPTIMIAEKASDLIRGEAPLGVRASAAG